MPYVALDNTLLVFNTGGEGWQNDLKNAENNCDRLAEETPGGCLGFDVCTNGGIYGPIQSNHLAGSSWSSQLVNLGCTTYLRGNAKEELKPVYVALITTGAIVVCWYLFGRTLFK